MILYGRPVSCHFTDPGVHSLYDVVFYPYQATNALQCVVVTGPLALLLKLIDGLNNIILRVDTDDAGRFTAKFRFVCHGLFSKYK